MPSFIYNKALELLEKWTVSLWMDHEETEDKFPFDSKWTIKLCKCYNRLLRHSQAVDNRASIPPIVLLLPLGQTSHQLQDGALGQGRVPIRWPANELEVLH